MHAAFIVSNNRCDVIFEYFEQLFTGIIVIVLLTAIGTNPARHLFIPAQGMPTNRHAVAFGKVHEIVAMVKLKLSPIGLQRIYFHFILGNEYVEIVVDGLRLGETVIVYIDAPHRDGHTYFLATFIGIVAQSLRISTLLSICCGNKERTKQIYEIFLHDFCIISQLKIGDFVSAFADFYYDHTLHIVDGIYTFTSNERLQLLPKSE